MSMKKVSDGITKVWSPCLSNRSFYAGGKIAFSGDQNSLTCIYDDNISIVDWDKGSLEGLLFDTSDDTREVVTNFCVHPKNFDLVLATQNNLLRHFVFPNKDCKKVLKHPHMPILAMDFDSSGILVVTGSSDKAIRVWDIVKGYCTHSFRDHTEIISIVKFHPDPNRSWLFSASDDNSIKIFDLIESKCIASFRDHMSTPTSLSFSEDGYLLGTSGRDKVINFYELRHCVHIKTIPVMEELEAIVILKSAHTSRLIQTMGINGRVEKKGTAAEQKSKGEGSHVVITAGELGILHLYQVSMLYELLSTIHTSALTRDMDKRVENPLLRITSIHYLDQRHELVVVNADYNFISYRIGAHDDQDINNTHSKAGLSLSRRLISCNDDILDIVKIPTIRVDALESSDSSHSTAPTAADPPEDDREKDTGETTDKGDYRFGLISNSNQVRIFDEGMRCIPLEGHTDTVLSISVSPDGKWLATSSKDRSCRVWDISSYACVAIAQGHADAVGAVAISQNFSSYVSKQVVLISGGGDKIIKRWAVPVNKLVEVSQSGAAEDGSEQVAEEVVSLVCSHSIRAHDKDVNAVAFAPNDSLVASASQDKSIRLWSTVDLSPRATLSGHRRGVWKLVFSPVDRVLASCSGDHTVKLWSMQDYSCIRTFQGHTCSVLSIAFINHGQQLLSGSSDGLIRLWTIRTGDCENTFDHHEGKVWALSSLDEDRFLSGGSDGSILTWKNCTQEEEEKRLQSLEENLLAEQQMQNDLRHKRYDRALAKAMELGHSHRILTILQAVLENSLSQQTEDKEQDSNTEGGQVPQDNKKRKRIRMDEEIALFDSYVKIWTDEDIVKIFEYLRDWNTNAKYTYVCQVLIHSLLRVIKIDRLIQIKSVTDNLSGLISYCDRHYHRVDRLQQATHMVEYVQSIMTGLTSSLNNYME